MNEYRLIVIGAGPGGYEAALHAANKGMKCAVVEKDKAGGTCLNRGCVPTKTLLHASEIYRGAKEAADMGIHAKEVRVSLKELFHYKQGITETLSNGVESLLKSAKVDLIKGSGKITGQGEVTVTDEAGEKTTLKADNILIATGAVPALPPVKGLDLPGVLTSDDILAGSDTLFDSMVIIGGGVIGVEFATFYADLGTQVTIVEGLDRLLPQMDKELGQNLAQLFKKRGIAIHTSAMVEAVEQAADGALSVRFSAKGEEQCVTAQTVLCAIGRSPYTEGLFAEGLQPDMEGRAIRVNERFATSIPGVYAIGDVSSKVQLAHVACAQGKACVDYLAGKTPKTDPSLVPGCIYTRPEIATTGMTEAQAKEAGINVKTGKCVMGANARTMIENPGRSFIKLVVNADDKTLIGAQLMCMHATDMISGLTQAIANRMTPGQLLKGMRPHPTYEEALTEALEKLDKLLGGL